MTVIVPLQRADDAAIVDTLRQMLARAERGEITSLAMVVLDTDGMARQRYIAGDRHMTLVGAVYCLVSDMAAEYRG